MLERFNPRPQDRRHQDIIVIALASSVLPRLFDRLPMVRILALGVKLIFKHYLVLLVSK